MITFLIIVFSGICEVSCASYLILTVRQRPLKVSDWLKSFVPIYNTIAVHKLFKQLEKAYEN